MNIDIETVKQTLGTIGIAISTLKQAKDLLPDGTKKTEISNTLEQAERQLKIAESQIAQNLGYELCKKYFPPEIMLSIDDKIWICPACENKKDKRVIASATIKTPK
jgi:hypothetical protein